ncbi:MAG TPA: STAS domain-containing protein [Streptosporangiaceae bacterium]|nr:STAS domain-containing protein [Streptosporangiaceae bacterium]
MDDRYPASKESRAAIVRMPDEIDIANAGRLATELASACDSGASVVVADMTHTTFCDASGARMLVVAQRRAAECGAELRAAVASARVRRVLVLLELDAIVPIHPTVEAACRA